MFIATKRNELPVFLLLHGSPALATHAQKSARVNAAGVCRVSQTSPSNGKKSFLWSNTTTRLAFASMATANIGSSQ